MDAMLHVSSLSPVSVVAALQEPLDWCEPLNELTWLAPEASGLGPKNLDLNLAANKPMYLGVKFCCDRHIGVVHRSGTAFSPASIPLSTKNKKD